MGDIVDGMFEQGLLDPPFSEDEDDAGSQSDRPWQMQPIVCRHCGTRGLYWRQTLPDGKWRLYENYNPHVCQPTADGFEDQPL